MNIINTAAKRPEALGHLLKHFSAEYEPGIVHGFLAMVKAGKHTEKIVSYLRWIDDLKILVIPTGEEYLIAKSCYTFMKVKLMPIRTVDAATLKAWLDKDEAIIIDVREPAEHAAESIPTATLLPLASVSVHKLPPDSGKKLVLHCRAGKRGATACEKLLAEKPDLEIYNLEGGISAWIQAGYEVKTSGKFFLPLDRQVQLTIGSGVLLGSVLGYFLNPTWFLLSGFFGLGLMNAGLTGWCGLALLMAKMPWNKVSASSQNFCMTKR